MHHLLAAILAILVLGVSKHHVTAFLNNRQIGGSQKSSTTSLSESSSQLIAETNVISTEDQDSNNNSNNNEQQYSPLLSAQDIQKISSGGVAIIPNWLPPNLLTKMREEGRVCTWCSDGDSDCCCFRVGR